MYKARNNVMDFADEFYVSMSSLMVIFKDYTMIVYRKQVRKLIESMDFDIFQPLNFKQQKSSNTVMNMWKKMFWLISFMQISFGLCVLITPTLDRLRTGAKYLPLVDCYPFYIYASPVYEIMYIYQSFLLFYLIFHSFLFDTFIAGLLAFCVAECDLLHDNLRNLKQQMTHIEYGNRLVKCIKHHEELRKFTRNIENLFSMVILEQYFCTLISCCTNMFKISVVEPMSVEFFKDICYQCSLLLQMYMFCWFATVLIAKSELLPVAAYDSYRLDASKPTQTNLKLFIGKTQHSLKIKTPLFSLSMEQYLQLLRNSFSYYAVLTTLNEK
ncbi:odorant receptor 46a-like [Diabrotica undecimpunctata]|uniref:odorant receptor 46a-like n=1 Tax=Diabrotica undecimpunctata TaxID=50387 RepID=UPI003B6379A5